MFTEIHIDHYSQEFTDPWQKPSIDGNFRVYNHSAIPLLFHAFTQRTLLEKIALPKPADDSLKCLRRQVQILIRYVKILIAVIHFAEEH
jgi:hypothetical protein